MQRAIRNFLALETAGGIVLIATACLALALANSPFGPAWLNLLERPWLDLPQLTIRHAVNDGLMTLFFLLVGLELKRELAGRAIGGVLAGPGAAALGGMIAPCLIYLAVAGGEVALWRGWAIPAATDIAFALAVLQLASPKGEGMHLRLFLTTLAVLDDLGAILIIGLFYTDRLSPPALLAALPLLLALIACNRRRVTALPIYLALGLLLWLAVAASGLHPTIAGVALALCIPAAPARRLEHKLHPLVAWAILPLFALVNAGVAFGGLSPATLSGPLPAAIALGLWLGKPLGIYGGAALAQRLRWSRLPFGRRQLLGTACLGGVGFTMALFIGFLAFTPPALQDLVRVGVLAGSLLAAVTGSLLLRRQAKA